MNLGHLPPRPVGYDAILAVFGDPSGVQTKPEVATWELRTLAVRRLPTPILYVTGQTLTHVRAHKLLVDHVVVTMMACLAAGVPPERLHYAGCYAWRRQRGRASKLSTHAWGIAVDLEPQDNPLGEAWEDDGIRLDPRVIDIFKNHGWAWGGDFNPRPDPMHFQWASGF